jgi:hypothetical protein
LLEVNFGVLGWNGKYHLQKWGIWFSDWYRPPYLPLLPSSRYHAMTKSYSVVCLLDVDYQCLMYQ